MLLDNLDPKDTKDQKVLLVGLELQVQQDLRDLDHRVQQAPWDL